MPIYEYECGACAERHEFIQKFSDGPKRKCPSCGKSRLRKLVSAAAFHLKGEGWYVTDFRDKDKKKNNKEDKSASTEAKSDTKSDASSGSTAESKPDAKSSEPKSEKKAGSSSKKGDSSATSAP